MTAIAKLNPDSTEPVTAANDVLIIGGADLHPEPIVWVWHGYLAQGKVHILAGPPGLGKTTIALAMAATITIGGRWPDGTRSETGNILVWSGEDDPADTLLPRLLASGAMRDRCHFIQGARDEDGLIRPFDPAKDIPALQIAMQRIGGVKLLIVDPIVSAVAGDSHKNTEVRRALQPLVDMAGASRCAVLGISHFSKGGAGGEPAQRVVGSVAFSAVARVVMAVAKVKDENGEEKRILVRAKSNIGADDGGFEYQLQQSEPLPGITASSVAWGKPVTGSARDLLAEPDREGREDSDSPSNELPMLIWQELRSGQAPSKVVEASLKEAGYTSWQIRAARKKMNVTAQKSGMEGGWYWRLADGFVPEKAWLDSVDFVTGEAKTSTETARRCGEGDEDATFKTYTPSSPSHIFEGESTTPIVTKSKPKEVF